MNDIVFVAVLHTPQVLLHFSSGAVRHGARCDVGHEMAAGGRGAARVAGNSASSSS